MELATYFRAQACNNAWANSRLLEACRRLTPEELRAERTGFFPSIIHTLNHTLTVDWFYVSALEGACVGYSVFEPEIPCPTMVDLEREQRAVDKRLIDLCRDLSELELAAPVELLRPTAIQTERADRVLLHLLQHQIHHRGQVHGMLSGTPVPPPQLDEFFLAQDRELRSAELSPLGLDESAIWR